MSACLPGCDCPGAVAFRESQTPQDIINATNAAKKLEPAVCKNDCGRLRRYCSAYCQPCSDRSKDV